MNELERAGYLTKIKDGRRNRTRFTTSFHFATPCTATHTAGDLSRFFGTPD